MLDVNFEPKNPTVVLLVDRSGTMFESRDGNPQRAAWYVLRTSVLQVVQDLKDEVRFGFAAFTGLTNGTCPIIHQTAPALNNYDAIAQTYSALRSTMAEGMGPGQTPTSKALQMVGAQLAADKSPGEKYILFVTDGEPDYCGDGNLLCPVDSVIWHLQTLRAQGIKTFVFGVSTYGDINTYSAILKAFANAGDGQDVAVPPPANSAQQLSEQCAFGGDANAMGWRAELAASMKMRTLATYSPTAGMATVYTPNPNDQMALTNELAKVISGVKSCVFDLAGKIKVNLDKLDQAGVSIDMRAIPRSDTNGWHMKSETQLELLGSACEAWRKPDAKNIQFNFPCDIIIL